MMMMAASSLVGGFQKQVCPPVLPNPPTSIFFHRGVPSEVLPLNWDEPFRLALVSQDIGPPLLSYQCPPQTEGAQLSPGPCHLLLAQQPVMWKGQRPFFWPGTS